MTPPQHDQRATQTLDRVRASHLLRRAGFAPDEGEIRRAMDAGLDATVDTLVTPQDEQPERWLELDALADRLALRRDIGRLRAWWMARLVATNRPLHARMALFWHDHFATSNAKVQDPPMMLRQLRLFESHAMGPFEELLLAVARDPAMIVWLDGNANVRGRPNENFARELFELFGLGVGHYTEHDIKEAARAFTGWHQRDGAFRFVRRNHDDAPKTVLESSGPLNGEDVVRLIVASDHCARFIGRKLAAEFVCPDPPPSIVDSIAATLRDTGFHIGRTLRILLAGDAMFDPRWYRARIKSPVEFVVGLTRSLDVGADGAELADQAKRMGQALFEPPGVEGWAGQRSWLNSATMLVRLNGAIACVQRANVDAIRSRYGADGAAGAVRLAADITLDGRVPAPLERRLAGIRGAPDKAMREALRLLITSPEYQMA